MKIRGNAKKADFIEAVCQVIWTTFLVCYHYYRQAKPFVLIFMLLLFAYAVYDMVLVIRVYRKQRKALGKSQPEEQEKGVLP